MLERPGAPNFDGYVSRPENFLTKEQLEEIELQKQEATERMQRIQAMKAKEERENKSRQRNNGNMETGHLLRFQYEDHQRVHEMKPLMKQMHSKIKTHYMESIFN